MDVRWKRGDFLEFYAYMKIRIGGKKDLPIDAIHQGDTFEYDGTMLRYAGAEFPQPGLRGAIKQNWAGTFPDQQEAIRQDVAPRQVARSQTVNKDLSKVQRSNRDPMKTDSLDEETVLEVGDRGKIEQKEKPRIMTASNNRRIMMSEEDAQDGQIIGRVRSPAKVKADVLDPRNQSLAKDIENRSVGKPEIFKKEGVNVEMNVGKVSGPVAVDESEGVVVSKVRHTEKVSTEGIEVKDTSDGAQKPKVAKKAAKKAAKVSPKLRIARQICPEFPDDWNFFGKLEDKMAMVRSMDDDPAFLDALYAAEGTTMRKHLLKEYPGRFSG